jgi:hypothetical protein
MLPNLARIIQSFTCVAHVKSLQSVQLAMQIKTSPPSSRFMRCHQSAVPDGHHDTVHEVGGGVGAEPVPAVRAHTLAFPLSLVDVVLELLGARIDELELRKLSVENANDLGERVIGLAGLAERLRCAVDLLDHLSEVFVELVEAVLEFLGELVTV